LRRRRRMDGSDLDLEEEASDLARNTISQATLDAMGYS
jgi:hypothetical protein